MPLQCGIRLAGGVLRIAEHAHATDLHAISIAAALAERSFGVDPLRGLYLGGAFQCSFQESLPDSGQLVVGRQGYRLGCHSADYAQADEAD